MQRPEAGDPAGFGPRARVLQGQLEGVIDAKLGPGRAHGPSQVRRRAPSPSAPACSASPRPCPRAQAPPRAVVLGARPSGAPAEAPPPRNGPALAALSRPDLPSAELTSGGGASSCSERAEPRRRPAAVSASDGRFRGGTQSPGLPRGVGGAACHGPSNQARHAAFCVPASCSSAKETPGNCLPTLTRALRARVFLTTLQMCKLRPRVFMWLPLPPVHSPRSSQSDLKISHHFLLFLNKTF